MSTLAGSAPDCMTPFRYPATSVTIDSAWTALFRCRCRIRSRIDASTSVEFSSLESPFRTSWVLVVTHWHRSTWNEEERPALANPTRLSIEVYQVWQESVGHAIELFGVSCYPLTLASHRAHRVAGDLRVNDVCPTPALGGLLMHQLASGQVVILTYVFRQPAIHQRVGFEAEFLIPGPILGLPSQYFLQAASREIFRPRGHSVLTSSETPGKNRQKIAWRPWPCLGDCSLFVV